MSDNKIVSIASANKGDQEEKFLKQTYRISAAGHSVEVSGFLSMNALAVSVFEEVEGYKEVIKFSCPFDRLEYLVVVDKDNDVA